MKMVYLIAGRSKDKMTHIGAVIVGPDHEIRSTGYNSFPRGILDNIDERQERPNKYFYFSHAETNAICNAALIGVSIKDCKIFTNGTPCCDCARNIINAGIREVIVDSMWEEVVKNKVDSPWNIHAEITRRLFLEADVTLSVFDGAKIGEVERYFNGEFV